MPDLFSEAFCISWRKEKGCLTLGCFEKIPLTGRLKQETFVTVLKAEKSKIKAQADFVSFEDTLPGLQKTAFFAMCSPGLKKRKLWFSSLLIRALSASGALPLWRHLNLIISQRPQLQISHWELGFQHMNIQHIAKDSEVDSKNTWERKAGSNLKK